MSFSQAAERIVDQVVERWKLRSRVPRATYRLQLHSEFTLRDALAIVPYLHELGISHLYVSSLVTAKPGSRHGYDVVDHTRLNPELGTMGDLTTLAEELHRREMGLILDIVANHMHVGPENAWWNDVLENGPSSPFAEYFDIAWQDSQRERLRGKVLLPILDEPYGRAVEVGKFRPRFDAGELFLVVNEMRLPLDPRTYDVILSPALERAKTGQAEDDPGVLELQSILGSVRHLPPREEPEPERVREGLAEIAVIKRRLRELTHQWPLLTGSIQSAVDELSGRPGDTPSFAALAGLLEAQAYRPCFWRVALDEINYRRFFDVNDLAALSTERLEVFRAIHALPLAWLQAGIVDGFRIDHIDGLRDPQEYLHRLQRHSLLAYAEAAWEASEAEVHDIPWPELSPRVEQRLDGLGPDCPRVYVVVEKILGERETLPREWMCDGTTGYDVLNEINGLFVDRGKAEAVDQVYRRFTGQLSTFGELVHDAKVQMLQSIMASELHMLAYRIDRLAQAHWYTQDFTLNSLRHALREILACFPVYRSYISDTAHQSDRVLILRAASQARRNNTLLGRPIFQFITDVLLLNNTLPDGVSDDYRQIQREIAGRFQQLTAPVTAKGVEDTALYRFNRLTSLNEVGGNPARIGRTTQELHEVFAERAAAQPGALTPLSTHDTKRSEDVRARINVLSECTEEWDRRLSLWRAWNAKHLTVVEDGTTIPDANEEYLLYQTLVGCWPQDASAIDTLEFRQRVQNYMIKAVREGKVHSSWINPDQDYDDAVVQYIERLLDSEKSPEFRADFQAFVQTVEFFGCVNSLAQTVLRCLCPGIPDIYQGSEFFDDSLVDPDNRRAVDYAARQAALRDLEFLPWAPEDPATWNQAKLFVLNCCLRLRQQRPLLFEHGSYLPLSVTGPHADHVFAFLRTNGASSVVVVVPRLLYSLSSPGALDATLSIPEPHCPWRSLLTQELVDLSSPVGGMLQGWPVGIWLTDE